MKLESYGLLKGERGGHKSLCHQGEKKRFYIFVNIYVILPKQAKQILMCNWSK